MRRISIGPGEVAGYMGQLRSGFEALGIPCEHFMFIPPHQYSYPTTSYFLRGTYERIARLSGAGRVGHYLYWVLEKCIRMIALFYAILRYDTFIFMGLGSFFRFLELPLLRALGKCVIVIYLGSDARPPYLSGRHLDDKRGKFDPVQVGLEARQIEKLIRRAEKNASVIVSHTGTAQFLRKPFVRLCAVGIPMQKDIGDVIKAALAEPQCEADAPLRILHAPSRPIAKGTLEFREVVERLKAEGARIELTELSGVPNHEVLSRLARCDMVLDELYSDLPLATLAAEAALFGKPVIVGSLYRDFYRDNPDFCEDPETDSPTFFIDPNDLEATVRRVVADPALRKMKGEQARAFLETRWTARAVSANYLRLAEGNAPESWKADPANIDYIGGWGLSRQNWRRQLRTYLDRVGIEGIFLDARPDLKQRIEAAAMEDVSLR